MKNMLIITCALLVGAQMESSVHTVKGHIGGKAVIECPYPPGCEHRQKYVCRGDCPPGNKDIPVQTAVSQVWAKTGRFSLHDNATARVFTVTITGLTAKDSGKYWCAVQFPWYNSDLYTELRIDIGPAPVTTLSPAIITGASTVLTFSPGKNISSVAPLVRTGTTTNTNAVFLYTSGCSSSNIYVETGGSAVEMGHSVPTVIQQHQNPITITSTTTSFSTTTSSPTSSSITTTSSPISSSITITSSSTSTTSSPTSSSITITSSSTSSPTSSSITTTSSSITTTSSPSSSSSTVPSAPPQVYEVPESLYQRMAPLACGGIPVPRDSSPSARTADGAEYMSMQDCARAADGAEYT